jgi:uncharacterized protein
MSPRARALVISDTHVPDFAGALPRAVLRAAARADVILHAGDVTSAAVLDELERLAPVHAALGNGDGPDVARWGARERVEIELAGFAVAIVHDSGPAPGRAARLRRWFPLADLIVFGHSHIPMSFREAGVRYLNPGSPTWKRRQPAPTYATIAIEERPRVSVHMISE